MKRSRAVVLDTVHRPHTALVKLSKDPVVSIPPILDVTLSERLRPKDAIAVAIYGGGFEWRVVAEGRHAGVLVHRWLSVCEAFRGRRGARGMKRIGS